MPKVFTTSELAFRVATKRYRERVGLKDEHVDPEFVREIVAYFRKENVPVIGAWEIIATQNWSHYISPEMHEVMMRIKNEIAWVEEIYL